MFINMRIERQLQDLLDVLNNLRRDNTDLKKKLKEATQLIKKQDSANKKMAKQNLDLRETGAVLDVLDEDVLFDTEATLAFSRTLDGVRVLKIKSLNTGIKRFTTPEGTILQQGVRKTLGRKECPVEA